MPRGKMTNEKCRAILLMLQNLHEIGFGGLRFMPTLFEHSWTIDVGPRLLFSCRDGSFVPYDLRHRLVRFSGPVASSPLDSSPMEASEIIYLGTPVGPHVKLSGAADTTPLYGSPFDGSPLEMLREAFYSSAARAQFGHEAKDSFDLFMRQCYLRDDDYYMWLKELRLFIDCKPDAFPNRRETEASRLEESVFYISCRSFQGRGYVNMASPAPPPGNPITVAPPMEEEEDKPREERIRSIKKRTCSTCKGLGKLSTQKIGNCPTCNAKGSIKKEEPCPDCFGEGIRVLESSGSCTKCKGKGWIRKAKCDEELCPDCNGDGTGMIKSSTACTTCKGKGQVEKEEHCPDCNGEGTRMITSWTSCKKCNGKGHTVHIIETHEELQQCDECNGKGSIEKNPYCALCDGRGFIVVKGNARKCWHCAGKGELDILEMGTCDHCHGVGYVFTEISVDITPQPRSR